MSENVNQEMPVWVVILIPLAFCVVFPLFWCFVMWINSLAGGWSRLAKFYRSTDEPTGKQWHGIQGTVGLVSYRGVLECVTNEEGIYLQPGMLFRFAHPRLFIPWKDWHEVRPRNILWLKMVAAKIGHPKVGSLSLNAKVIEHSEGRALLSEQNHGG